MYFALSTAHFLTVLRLLLLLLTASLTLTLTLCCCCSSSSICCFCKFWTTFFLLFINLLLDTFCVVCWRPVSAALGRSLACSRALCRSLSLCLARSPSLSRSLCIPLFYLRFCHTSLQCFFFFFFFFRFYSIFTNLTMCVNLIYLISVCCCCCCAFRDRFLMRHQHHHQTTTTTIIRKYHNNKMKTHLREWNIPHWPLVQESHLSSMSTTSLLPAQSTSCVKRPPTPSFPDQTKHT